MLTAVHITMYNQVGFHDTKFLIILSMIVSYYINSYFGEVIAAGPEVPLSRPGHSSVTAPEITNMTLSPKGRRGYSIFQDRSTGFVNPDAVSFVSGANSRF